MPRLRRVALLIDASRAYGRGLLEGITTYVQIHGGWSIYLQEDRALGDPVPHQLGKWKPDGIIARIESRKMIRQIRELNLCTVDVYGTHRLPGIPAFCDDEKAEATLAAEHLLERGFRHFAYCGLSGLAFSERIFRLFKERVRKSGHPVSVFGHNEQTARPTRTLSQATASTLARDPVLLKWLRSLPKPIGLMACNDMRAQHVLRVCADAGIHVPDEIAVIGVDNDQVQCELCRPALTSIEPNTHRIGFEASKILDKMMRGQAVKTSITYIEPIRVVGRKSTDLMAISDPDTVAAIRFIREHACEGINVKDVARQLRMSRSTLERRFEQHLGRPPHGEIMRIRLQRVAELLAQTDFTQEKISRMAGFLHVESMIRSFTRTFGKPPGQYRGQLP